MFDKLVSEENSQQIDTMEALISDQLTKSVEDYLV